MFPITAHTETDEVFLLSGDLRRRIVTAGGAEPGVIDLAAGLADLLLDVQFDST